MNTDLVSTGKKAFSEARHISDLESSPFLIGEARRIVSDLFLPNQKRYWADFLLSWTFGVICFRFVRDVALFSPTQLVLFFTSCILYYRSALFIHEIVHREVGQGDSFHVFSFFWNLLCGIPFLIPSFVYYTHHDHHRGSLYGTQGDGEYISLAHKSPWYIVLFLAQAFVIPPLAVVRFGLLTPLSWLSRNCRDWMHRHASSMIMDPSYIRPLPSKSVLRVMRLQELGCFLFLLLATVLFVRGRIPIFVLGQAYCTAVVIVGLNAIRTLGAHRWRSDGEKMSVQEQMLDSLNFPRNTWLSCLWAPVGLRFHALHHIFPSMPYHNLAKAHYRLMNQLPLDSPYRSTEARSLTSVLIQLWKEARQSVVNQSVKS